MRRLAAVAAFALVTAACSGIETGTVTDKTYEVPYVQEDFICAAYSTQGICQVHAPVYTDVPECWRIWFAEGEDTNSACVARGEWDKYKVGDHFDMRGVS